MGVFIRVGLVDAGTRICVRVLFLHKGVLQMSWAAAVWKRQPSGADGLGTSPRMMRSFFFVPTRGTAGQEGFGRGAVEDFFGGAEFDATEEHDGDAVAMCRTTPVVADEQVGQLKCLRSPRG